MAESGRKGAGGREDQAAPPSELTPSGVIPRGGGAARPGRRADSEPPSFRSLTPYQARLDVEMDDTAVSKVRDPSVSISLGAEHALTPRPDPRRMSREALASVVLGTLLGALLVVALALVVRLFTR